MKNIITHFLIIFLSLLVILGVPTVLYKDFVFGGFGIDALSGATIELPDAPSGNFIIQMKVKDKYFTSAKEWENFFNERDYDVLMEDVNCLVAIGDESAYKLAERYMARLAVNQMKIRRENVMLTVSKAENRLIDILIMSEEYAEAYKLRLETEGIKTIKVEGKA